MDLNDDEVQRRAEADRREVEPPIQVETATSSKGGQLDWWVKERQEWWGRVRSTDGRQRWLDRRHRQRWAALAVAPRSR